MQIIKYNRGNDKSSVMSIVSSQTNIYNNSNSEPSGSRGDGGFIVDPDDDVDDASNIFYGTVYVKNLTENENDDDSDPYTEQGNLEVDGTTQSKDVYALEHYYINVNGQKKDLMTEYIFKFQSQIDSLNTQVTNLNTSVGKLNALLMNHINDSSSKFDYVYKSLDSHSNDIEDLSTRLSKISTGNSGGLNPDGSTNNPVILFSGIATRSGTTYSISGAMNEKMSLTPSVKDGLMTITVDVSSGYQANIYAVSVTQRSSSKTAAIGTTKIQSRNWGAFWFESRVNSVTDTAKIYIREFHQADSNNDSWDSTNWVDELQSVNIIVTGYISEKSPVIQPDPVPVTEDFYIQIIDNSYRTQQITGVYLFYSTVTEDNFRETMLNGSEAMEQDMFGSVDTAYYKSSIIDGTVAVNRGYGVMFDVPVFDYAHVYVALSGYSPIYAGQVRIEPNNIGSAVPVNISSL